MGRIDENIKKFNEDMVRFGENIRTLEETSHQHNWSLSETERPRLFDKWYIKDVLKKERSIAVQLAN